MSEKIKISPADVVITCAPTCNCDEEHKNITTDLANVMSVGMPICPDCGEEMDFSFVEITQKNRRPHD